VFMSASSKSDWKMQQAYSPTFSGKTP
jgi:hypothetical protein